MNKEARRPGVGFGVMMLRDGRVLLGRRHGDSAKADSELHGEGTWTMPGGKLEFQESFENGAAREVLEETGMKIDGTALRVVSVSNDIVHDAHFITVGLLCERFSGDPKVMEPDEITEWRWFPLDALPKPLFPPSERVLKNHLKGVVYQSYGHEGDVSEG